MTDISIATVEALRQLLKYEPETGKFHWKKRAGVRPEGAEAFTYINPKGYLTGQVLGEAVRAHRAAWAIYHGAWPSAQIDHINGIRTDNRIANLREATASQNQRNKAITDKSKFGVMGVSLRYGKWQAKICVNGVQKHIGTYSTLDSATAARKNAEAFYGFHENHGRTGISPDGRASSV